MKTLYFKWSSWYRKMNPPRFITDMQKATPDAVGTISFVF